MHDRELLRAFARQKSEAAFQELVRRHAGLVYSCARQRVGDAHAALVSQVSQAALAGVGGGLGATPPVKQSECTYTLLRRNSGGNVWEYRFPQDDPAGHVADCWVPGDPHPPVIRNEYLSQQTADLFWNAVMDGRLDQALAVADTPFAWGIDPVGGRADLQKRLESPEFKAMVAALREEPSEIVLVPDAELPRVLQQKFHLADTTNNIAVVAWVSEGKARILVAVRAGDPFKVVGIGD